MIELTLPFPPTVNTYWRHVGARTLLSKRGREYRKAVRAYVLAEGFNVIDFVVDVEVSIVAHPPDRRKRDLDNLPKAILDALQHAGVFADDNQVARLVIERGALRPGGEVTVTLATMGDGAEKPRWLVFVDGHFQVHRTWEAPAFAPGRGEMSRLASWEGPVCRDCVARLVPGNYQAASHGRPVKLPTGERSGSQAGDRQAD